MILAAQSVTEQIADLVLYATVVTLGLSLAFAFALIGTVHATDARREHRTVAAIPWTVLAVLGYGVFIALAVKGIVVVTQK